MSRSEHSQKHSEWRERFRQFAQSTLTVVDFCRRERVSTPSFYRWRQKLAESSSSHPSRRSSAPTSFIPVHVTPETGLQVAFPNGVRLTLPVEDHELVVMAIGAIAQIPIQEGAA